MPSTDRLKLPLYTDEETPDISTSGHYNESMRLVDAEAAKLEAADAAIKSDIDTEVARATAAEQANASAITAEVTRATAADETNANAITAEVTRATAAEQANASAITAEVSRATAAEKKNAADITAEVTRATAAEQAEATARTEADTALGGRIDNAEAEISANSADLTGIKGLTYGTDHVTFLENENGSYTSPALEEIAEQIANAGGGGMNAVVMDYSEFIGKISTAHMKTITETWPNVFICASNMCYWPLLKMDDGLYFAQNDITDTPNNSPAISRITAHKLTTTAGDTYGEALEYSMSLAVEWPAIAKKPFDSIGDTLAINKTQAGNLLNINVATPTRIGGVRVGSGLTIASDGVLSVTRDDTSNLVASDGVLSVTRDDTPHLVAEINPTTATDAEKSTFSKAIWDATGGTMGGAHRLVLKSSMSTPGGSVDGFRSVDVTEMYPITDPTRLTLKILADTSLTRFAATVYKTDDNGTVSYSTVFENISVAPISTEQKLSIYSL